MVSCSCVLLSVTFVSSQLTKILHDSLKVLGTLRNVLPV